MKSNVVTSRITIRGMTCVNCENKIENKLKKTIGVKQVKISYNDGIGTVTYDADLIKLNQIVQIIEALDYQVGNQGQNSRTKADEITNLLGMVLILFAVYVFLRRFGVLNLFNIFPQAEEGMGYGMLFLIGLMTSVHCIAMCGGISLSQCIPQSSKSEGISSLKPSALYNVGRVISYTVIGGIVGALGSVISFSGSAKGVVQIAAGTFMVIMGLNMLNLFPGLRRFMPRMPKGIAAKVQAKKNNNSPFYVGLLNGLMPCGPLQAMQLYALSTGDPIKGAFSMFLFSLGTVPLMFGLGALSSILSRKFTQKVMMAGSILVVVLGISMFNSGMSLSGFAYSPMAKGSDASQNQAQIEDDVQIIQTFLKPGRYDAITVQAGTPVRWTITAESGTINGCNNRIFIPEYGIEKAFQVGDNVIEFTPTESGTFSYSCWMGMIRSSIVVLEAGQNAPDSTDTQTEYNDRIGLFEGGGGCCN